jgi:TatD DNase family protein
VLERAKAVGCDRLLIASGYIQDAILSYEICKRSEKYYTTAGVHPCRANEVFKYGSTIESYKNELEKYI